MTKRTAILTGVLAVLLAAAAAWAYDFMADRHRSALTARQALAGCKRMAAEIQRLASRPTMASDHERLSAETTGLIEKAARSATIPADKLTRITPEPLRRLEDTVYKEKPTQVLLKNVTLRQLVRMIHELAGGQSGLHPKSIRLTAPRAEDTGNTWTAELVLTYLVYDPPVAGR